MKTNLLHYIWQHSRRQQIVIVVLTLLSFPALYLSLEIPKLIINETLTNPDGEHLIFGFRLDSLDFLIVLCFGLLGLIIFNGLLKMRINTLKGIIGERLIRRLRYELINRMLGFPLMHFSRASQGELISTLTAEAEPIAGYISESIALPLFQGGTMLTILYFMFMQDWLFGLASVALIPIQGYVIPKLQAEINRLKKARIKQVRKLSERIGETITGAQEIRLQGTQRYTLSEFSFWLSKLFDIRLEIFKKKFFMKFLNNTIGQFTPFMFYLFGGYLVIEGQITIGALVAALAAYKDLTSPWKELLNHYQAHEDAKIKYQQILEQFNPAGMTNVSVAPEQSENDLDEAPIHDQSPGHFGAISIRNLSWESESGQRLLNNVSANFKVGESIAIVGQNAIQRAGIAHLLAGLEPATSGRILFDEVEMTAVSNRALRTRIGYQGPDPHLFNGTIFHNVTYGLNHDAPPSNNDDPETLRRLKESRASGNSTDIFSGDWVSQDLVNTDDAHALRELCLECAAVTNTDKIMYQLGLMEYVDPKAKPELAASLLGMRQLIHDRLIEENLSRVVAEFDPDLYNRNATVGENILFGVPGDESLRMKNLARLPYLRELFEELGIFREAVRIGEKAAMRLAQRVIDLPQGHILLNQFDLEDEEDVKRLSEIAARYQGREKELSEEQEIQFLSIFLHIIPELHAFGFIHDALADQLLRARTEFQLNAPPALRDKVVRFDRSEYHGKLNVLDNLLFGRVVAKEPAAEKRIAAIVEETLTEHELKSEIMFLLSESQVGINGSRLSLGAQHTIALIRILVKKPELLIFHDALTPYGRQDKVILYQRIRHFLPDSTIVWIDREVDQALNFDQTCMLTENGDLVSNQHQLESVQNVEPTQLLSFIGQSKIFGGLDVVHQQLLAEHSRIMTAAAGEYVYRTGDPGRNTYLLISGRAESIHIGDETTVIGNLGPGETFGLIEVIVHRTRILAIRAETDLKLLRIDGDTLRELVDNDSNLLKKLVLALTEQWASH